MYYERKQKEWDRLSVLRAVKVISESVSAVSGIVEKEYGTDNYRLEN